MYILFVSFKINFENMPVVALCLSPSPCLRCQPSYMGGPQAPPQGLTVLQLPPCAGSAPRTFLHSSQPHWRSRGYARAAGKTAISTSGHMSTPAHGGARTRTQVSPGLFLFIHRLSEIWTISPQAWHPKRGHEQGVGEGEHDMGFLVQKHLI